MALSMSSAAAGGGGGALSTAAMAHHQPAVITRIQPPKPPPGTHHHGPSMAVGADVVDKRLTRLARSTRHLPLVCIDLAGGGHIAYHAPVEGEYASNRGVCLVKDPIGTDLILPANDDKIYKSVRRYLTRGLGYEALLLLGNYADEKKKKNNDTNGTIHEAKNKKKNNNNNNKKDGAGNIIIQEEKTADDDAAVVVISKPYSLLGLRRIQELHPSLRSSYQLPSSTSAIDSIVPTIPTLHDQALDGSPPKGDTYDRVWFHIPLHKNKKHLGMLPDEAVDLVLLQAKLASCKDIIDNLPPKQPRRTATATTTTTTTTTPPPPLLQEENLTTVPLAIAVPGYASHDAALESWMELLSKDDIECASALLFPRSAAAVMASLLTPPTTNPKLPPPLLQRTKEECQKLTKDAQRLLLDVEEGSHLDPLIVTVGVTCDEGYEITAMQLSKSHEIYPYFEEYRYHHTRCALFPSSESSNEEEKNHILSTELTHLFQDLAVALPGRKPCAILAYSNEPKYTTKLEQLILQTWNEKISSKSEVSPPILTCKENAVAFGTVLLAAAKCDRLDSNPIGIRLVSNTSVGLRISYFGSSEEKKPSSDDTDDDVKVIFDFDRRLPAGPYVVEFTATECAAKREGGTSDLQKLEGKKGIPKREEAALNFTVQVVQRQDRFSDWVPVDDIMYPLRMEKISSDNNDGDDDQKQKETPVVACESARFEIRMKSEGTLVSTLSNDGVSVVQAEKSARSSLLQYYGGWIFFILFFGGFLFKSYWEDYVFQRDTKRVLAYYKRAIPNSFNDGDENNARYLVYKYQHKKDKLWARLEKKYGYPIPDDWDLFVKEVEEEEDAKKGTERPSNRSSHQMKDSDFSHLDLDNEDSPKSEHESKRDQEL